jgi:AcrR family transcriptional regulator
MQRKSAILHAANHHFAHHGFRGASLRDIARDAGVSLTLLNHHFGSKLQLLGAVIEAHRNILDERASRLHELMQRGPGSYTLKDLVQVWVTLGFDTASRPDGEMFLRLVARVIDDPTEEALQVVREKLDDAALVFIDALQQVYPGASRYAAASAYIFVSAAMLKFLVGSKRLFRLARVSLPVQTRAEDETRLTRFLVAGIEAAMAVGSSEPEQDPSWEPAASETGS